MMPRHSNSRHAAAVHTKPLFTSLLITFVITFGTVHPSRADDISRCFTPNADVVNVTFESNGRNAAVMYSDRQPVNFTVIIYRSQVATFNPGSQIILNLTSPYHGDGRSKPPPTIGIQGLETAIYTLEDPNQSEFRFIVEVSGYRIGRGRLMVTAQNWSLMTRHDAMNTAELLCSSFEVPSSYAFTLQVHKPPVTTMASAFLYLLIVAVVLNMLAFSVRLHTDVVRYHLRHPFPIAIGLGCQCIIMPIIGYVLGLIFDLPSYLRYSLLVLACSPGGGPSNFVTVLLRGDIHMSVLMTCFSNLFSIAIMPLWLYTLGVSMLRVDFPSFSMSMSWSYLVGLGVLYFSPAFFGGLYRQFVNEKTSLKTSLIIRLFGFVSALVGLIGVIYCNVWVFEYLFDDWRETLASTILCHTSYIISFLFALIGRRSPQARLTIAIEAGFQNFSTALFIAQLTCPPPEGTFIYTTAIVYFLNIIAVSIVALVVVIAVGIYRGPEGEPLAVEVGYDTSPEVADMYSISKTGELKTDKSSSDLSATKDNLGFSTTGSFVSLSDMW